MSRSWNVQESAECIEDCCLCDLDLSLPDKPSPPDRVEQIHLRGNVSLYSHSKTLLHQSGSYQMLDYFKIFKLEILMESVDVRIFRTSCHVPKVFPLIQWFRATSIPAPWTTCLGRGRTNSSYGFWWWLAGYCPTWQWFLSIFLSSHRSGLKNPWNEIIYSNDSTLGIAPQQFWVLWKKGERQQDPL